MRSSFSGTPGTQRIDTVVSLQDDHVMGTLTVKENLLFSANLRLPSSTTVSDRMQRVDETIQELGLTECQNTKVTCGSVNCFFTSSLAFKAARLAHVAGVNMALLLLAVSDVWVSNINFT